MQGLSNFTSTANAPYSAGPPFPALAAENGLSVDPVTGRIVLGENAFGGSLLSALQNPREIPLNGNQIYLTDNLATFLMQFSNGGAVALETTTQSRAEISATTGGGFMSVESDSILANPPQFILNDVSTIPAFITRLRQVNSDFQIFSDTLGGRKMLTLDEFFGVYAMGDIEGVFSGIHSFIDAGPGTFEIRNTVTGEYMLQSDFGNALNVIGDINNITTGAKETINLATSLHDFSDTLLGASYSCNGVAGFTGTVTPVTSITVNGGIVTAVT